MDAVFSYSPVRIFRADGIEVFVGRGGDGCVELSDEGQQVVMVIARVVDHCVILNHDSKDQ